jgi:hypothetical protein
MADWKNPLREINLKWDLCMYFLCGNVFWVNPHLIFTITALECVFDARGTEHDIQFKNAELSAKEHVVQLKNADSVYME